MRGVLLGIIGILFFLPSCSVSYRDSIYQNKAQIVVPISGNPSFFDPRRVIFPRDLALIQHLFVGLYKNDQNGVLHSKLVDRIEISEDKKTYTLHLKKTLWSDKTPVTAYDFRDSWLQVLSPNFPSPYSGLFYIIKNAEQAKQGILPIDQVGIRAPSEYCLVIELINPISYFFNVLSFPTLCPVHSSLREEVSGSVKDLVSNGPFVLKKWDPEVLISLEKNPLYVDESDVSINSIQMKIIKNASTALLMFQKGEVDWIGFPWSDHILPESLEKLREKKTLCSAPVAGTSWAICNVTSPYLKSAKIRKALAMSINRQEIISQVTKGLQVPAGRILAPFLARHTIANPVSTDFEEAKLLFEEALDEEGLTKEDFFECAISYIGTDYVYAKTAELLNKQWADNLGIQVRLDPCEFRYFLEKREQGYFDLLLCNWYDDLGHPLPYLEFFKTQKMSNGTEVSYYSKWKSSEFDSLLDLAIRTTDLEKQSKYLKEAEECIMNDMPLLPLYHTAIDYGLSDRVHKVTLFHNGLVDFITATVDN